MIFSSIVSYADEFSDDTRNTDAWSDDQWNEEFLDDEVAINDPLEPINRLFFKINMALDSFVLGVAVSMHQQDMHDELKNFLDNLSMPVSAVMSLLVLDLDNSLKNVSSFIINSTVGVFGLANLLEGTEAEPELIGFDNVIVRYGGRFSENDPFLVIPVLGLYTVAEFGSVTAFNSVIDPLAINVLGVGRDQSLGESVLSNEQRLIKYYLKAAEWHTEHYKSGVAAVAFSSPDPYVVMRNAHIRNRRKRVKYLEEKYRDDK